MPAPSVSAVLASIATQVSTFGPGETLTLTLTASSTVVVSGTPALALSNGAVATYTSGSGSQQLLFTYTPSITDQGSSALAVDGLTLPSGALITDSAGDELIPPATTALGLELLTSVNAYSVDPRAPADPFLTSTDTPSVTVGAERGETVTLYDGSRVVGTGTTPDDGSPAVTYTEIAIAPTTPLSEGQNTLIAVATDSAGRSSAASAPFVVTVDTTSPIETITDLAVDTTNVLTQAEQESEAVTITGRSSASLGAGETVEIALPGGDIQPATVSGDGLSFSFTLGRGDAQFFAIGGTVSAYVVDEAGNKGAAASQSYTVPTQRTITLASASPGEPNASAAYGPSLSSDGHWVAFQAYPIGSGSATGGDGAVKGGLYLEDLRSGAATLIDADGSGASVAKDAAAIAYVGYDPVFGDQIRIEAPGTGTKLLVSAAAGSAGASSANGSSDHPSLSADGATVVFESNATNLIDGGTATAGQIFVGRIADGKVTLSLASDSAGSAEGSDVSGDPTISADGSTVAFDSRATNLLGSNDPHTANLLGSSQIYVKALSDNASTGLKAGAVELVSGLADGTVGNTASYDPVLSGNGRYVVFQSTADNLVPSFSEATPYQQIYIKDLVTGAISLVSTAADGTVADQGAETATISDDGSTVFFSSFSDNLLGATTVAEHDTVTEGQLYAKNLATGAITLVSEAGYLPGSSDSLDPSVSGDGSTVAFHSYAPNLVGGIEITGDGYGEHVYVTTLAASGATEPSVVTIDPVNGDDTITAADIEKNATTAVTGTAPASDGQTLTLSLQGPGGPAIALGTTIVGSAGAAAGHWSLNVSSLALDAFPSGDYALVASVADATGAQLSASEKIALTVPVATAVYDYQFKYKDGSFYRGTVADDGTYAYRSGETIDSSGGQYTILDAVGTTTQAAGTVTTSTYYDTASAKAYTPILFSKSQPNGSSGLGSESDQTSGGLNLQLFGKAGTAEALQAATTLYNFYYRYNDGSYYYGTVAGNSNYGYTIGEQLSTAYGYYYIYASAGGTTKAAGTVDATNYFDVTTGSFYVPTKHALGQSDGTSGLGGEFDFTKGADGSQAFGLGGLDEAKQEPNTFYKFYYKYTDGSYYYGTVVGGSGYGYYTGESLNTAYGNYYIYASAGGTTEAAGTVDANDYYDVTTGSFYVPTKHALGQSDGTSGLGSEFDFTKGANGSQAFGLGGLDEAKQEPNTVYDFYFRYNDSSYYYGTVVGGSGYGYYTGDSLKTAYGYYYIYASAGGTTQAAGTVDASSYFDVTTASFYVPTKHALGHPDGTSGLGSEYDFTKGADGSQPFGLGGLYEAKQEPNTSYKFYFRYNDGSYYYGTVVGGSGYGYSTGESLNTAYGYYYLYASTGGTTELAGTVDANDYYDVTTASFYVPTKHALGHADGTSGLGSEYDFTKGADGSQAFGIGGLYEAKQEPNTVYNFYYKYNDGSYYYGTVIGDSGDGYYTGESLSTAHGYYYLYASTGGTTKAAGTVTTSNYFDVTTGSFYTPYETSLGRSDGTSGLGTEYDYTKGANGYQGYGYAGAYEAKQEPNTLYNFYYKYNDGSYYYGTVAGAGSYGYSIGESVSTAKGNYYIYSSAGGTTEAAGTVATSNYFDVTIGLFYSPYYYAHGGSDGSYGLGSELDYTDGANGYQAYGEGGAYEAKQRSAIFNLLKAPARALDGYIQGGTVGTLDPNAPPGTDRIDATQPTAVTDAEGRFVLGDGTVPLILTGGIDTATGLPFEGILEAPAGSSILSPITTLIEKVAQASGDVSLAGVAAAETLVATALGLPSTIDYATYDPEGSLLAPASSTNQVSDARTIYAAGATLLDVETLIDAAGGSSETALGKVALAIALKTMTDLTDPMDLIEEAGLTPTAVTAVSIIASSTEAALAAQLSRATVAQASFFAITGASIAEQGDGAKALREAGDDFTSAATAYVESLNATLATDDALAATAAITTPVAPHVALTRDTGASDTDGITADASLTVTPALGGGALSYVIDGSMAVLSYDPSTLGEGSHTVAVSEVSPTGLRAAAATLTFTLDATPPGVTIGSIAKAAGQAVETVRGTVDVVDAGTIVSLLDDQVQVGTALVATDGTWSATVSVEAGTRTISASDADLAGNVGTSASVGFAGKTGIASYNPDGSVHDIDYTGIPGQRYTSYDVLYGVNRKPASATYSDGVVRTWTYNADQSIHDIAYANIPGQAYRSEDILYGANGKPASATYSNGMTAAYRYNEDGSLHDVLYATIPGQDYTSYDQTYGANVKPASATYANGDTADWTYGADGSLLDILYTKASGHYASSDTDYGAAGEKVAKVFETTTGATKVEGLVDGLTFTAGPDALSVAADGRSFSVAPLSDITLTGGGQDETFELHDGFGHAVITDFLQQTIAAVAHDTIALGPGAFTGYDDLVSRMRQDGANTLIATHEGDSVILQNVIAASLSAADFKFA